MVRINNFTRLKPVCCTRTRLCPQTYGSRGRQSDLPNRMPPDTDLVLMLVLEKLLGCLKGSEEGRQL